MHFLVDGYNLLHLTGLLKRRAGPTGLQKARTALVGTIAGALGEQAGEVTVVFDAAGAHAGSTGQDEHRGVRVLFALENQQADDLIEELIRNYSIPRRLTVVSNDHRLIKAAQHRGCAVMACDDFLDWLRRQYRRRPSPPLEPKEKAQGLAASQTDRWLREFADLDADPELGEELPFDEE